ncbi:hypothetical protein [Frankia sp. R82]|uniref:hypothetical protein n=1 Tax=Frankia sp. R82 TaxID=2950553 RepID=UPI002043FD9B|nr:hypothetical protein [Frankia sp. R82]MCM3887328.1 hypothetical protein [Frankia sp. R82]
MYIDPIIVKILLLALAGAVAACAALITAYLDRRAGAHWAAAVLRAGTSFAGTLALEVLVLNALGLL